MMKDYDVDVLICGAGAAGLTLAIDLARRGHSLCLIEKMDRPFAGSRGKGIQPRSQEILEDLGVLDRIAAQGGVYPPQRLYTEDGSHQESNLAESAPPTPAEPYRALLLVPQCRTEAVLRERLAEWGAQPRFGSELLSFEQDGASVTARIRDDSGTRTLRARYLVGADGGKSVVRQSLGIGFPGKTLGVRAIVADVALSGLDRTVWHRFNEGSMPRQISFCPLPGTALFQLQGPVPLEGAIDLSAAGLTALVAERTRRTDILIESVTWASAFSMSARLADHYRVGRVFLAGDAAHVHPPTGGQGLNTSLQDAYNLGWKLSAALHGAPDPLLDSYEAERRPIAAQMLGLTSKLLDAMSHGATRRGREFQQLDLGYPASSLGMENCGRPVGMMAGERAPDASVRGAAGQLTRLFALFQGPSWTLLGYEIDRAAITPRAHLTIHTFGSHGDLTDENGQVQATYDMRAGDWVLVRPDGYIGAIGSAQDTAALERDLAKVGLAA